MNPCNSSGKDHSLSGVLLIELCARSFVLLLDLVQVVVVLLLELLPQRTRLVVLVGVLHFPQFEAVHLCLQHTHQFVDAGVPDGLAKSQGKVQDRPCLLASLLLGGLQLRLRLRHELRPHHIFLDVSGQHVDLGLHLLAGSSEVVVDAVGCHFGSEFVFTHSPSKVGQHALHDLAEDAFGLLLDGKRVEGDQRLQTAHLAVVLFAPRTTTRPPPLRHSNYQYITCNPMPPMGIIGEGSGWKAIERWAIIIKCGNDNSCSNIWTPNWNVSRPATQPTPSTSSSRKKLNQIERKLVSLKAQPPPEARPYPKASEADKDIKQMRKKKEVACQSQAKAERHEAVQWDLSKVEQEAQITPQKQLNIISKIMSEGHFQPNPNSNHKDSEGKRKEKKGGSGVKTAKTQQLGSNQKYNSPSPNATAKKTTKGPTYNNKSSQKKLSQRHSSQKYLNKTVQDSHLIQHLQKDIDLCMKSNAQLRVKVNQLQGYKNQYCKLRELITKFERQRKGRRT